MKQTYTFSQMEKISGQSPLEIIKNLGFEETIRLACAMLMNEKWEQELQLFATSLLTTLRKEQEEKWNSSWRFDGLLGFANDIILDYDERYNALKRALDKIQPPPPELLIAYARCYWAPGKPLVTEEEAISLVKEAMKDKIYIEGASLLRGLYKCTNNLKEQVYWEGILDLIKDNGERLTRLDKIPNITE